LTISEHLSIIQEELERIQRRFGTKEIHSTYDRGKHEQARFSENILATGDMFHALSEDVYYLTKACIELCFTTNELVKKLPEFLMADSSEQIGKAIQKFLISK